MNIDLDKLNAGDEVKLGEGTILIFKKIDLSFPNFPYRFSKVNSMSGAEFGFKKNGCYHNVGESSCDISEIIKKPFDFSILPDNCELIIIGGITYTKVTKWEASDNSK